MLIDWKFDTRSADIGVIRWMSVVNDTIIECYRNGTRYHLIIDDSAYQVERKPATEEELAGFLSLH